VRDVVVPSVMLAVAALGAVRLRSGWGNDVDRVAAAMGEQLRRVAQHPPGREADGHAEFIAGLDRDLEGVIGRVPDWELRKLLIQLQACWREVWVGTRAHPGLTMVRSGDVPSQVASRYRRAAAAEMGMAVVVDVHQRTQELLHRRAPRGAEGTEAEEAA